MPGVESKLSEANVTEWLGGIREQEVEVSFPKFKMTSEFELSDTLIGMGMQDAFSSMTANFSGMTGTRDLFISKVIHKAFVDVDEKGNIVSMTIEHAKANAEIWEFSYQEMSRQTA